MEGLVGLDVLRAICVNNNAFCIDNVQETAASDPPENLLEISPIGTAEGNVNGVDARGDLDDDDDDETDAEDLIAQLERSGEEAAGPPTSPSVASSSADSIIIIADDEGDEEEKAGERLVDGHDTRWKDDWARICDEVDWAREERVAHQRLVAEKQKIKRQIRLNKQKGLLRLACGALKVPKPAPAHLADPWWVEDAVVQLKSILEKIQRV